MKKDIIEANAKLLVDITIQKHNEKVLGKEKMSKFIKKHLTKEVKDIYYDQILHLYNKYLAKEGYEIKKDINNFDIIEYNSEEYQKYMNKL